MTGRGFVLCEGSDDDVRVLRAAYVRHLANCRQRFASLGPELPPAVRDAHARTVELVRRASAVNERQLLHCFASPAIGTPLRCLGLRTTLPGFAARIGERAAALIPQLLLEMGLRRLLGDDAVVWSHGAPPLASLAIGGRVVAPDGATGLRFSPAGLTALAGDVAIATLPFDRMPAAAVEPGGFRFERRARRIGNVTHLTTLDFNPIASFETHPNKSGNHVDLGGRDEAEWSDTLDQVFALVETHLPRTFAEMRMLLHEVVPVGYDEVRHLSASYREAIGTIYLTLHPNLMTMTEAVVHEFQHNKFNVAAESLEFLSNAFHPLYPSPVRPDPRPLWGILLAVHAFLPVAELYRRMRDAEHPFAALPGFDRRLSDIDLKNHEGMQMLRAHARFTPAGVALFAELEAMERRHLSERAARGLPNTPTEVHVA